jgi:hypothetical protein
MYYSGVDPYTMEKVYVTRNPHEKAMQRALMQYTNPRNYRLVVEALRQAGREDLIGHGANAWCRPMDPVRSVRVIPARRTGSADALPVDPNPVAEADVPHGPERENVQDEEFCMKKLLWLCCLGVLWAAALTAGCGEQADEAHTVILYSDLDESFVQNPGGQLQQPP